MNLVADSHTKFTIYNNIALIQQHIRTTVQTTYRTPTMFNIGLTELTHSARKLDRILTKKCNKKKRTGFYIT
jgi:zona occludens toxin (predicted ATPase)